MFGYVRSEPCGTRFADQLLGDLQAAEARLSATYPEIFTRAWADHEAMLAALDDLTAADRVRVWVTAKHTAMA
jgi:hypothetical protein